MQEEEPSAQTVGVSQERSSQWEDRSGEERPASFSAASRYPETARLIPETKLLTSK